jgi:hypothetical protein
MRREEDVAATGVGVGVGVGVHVTMASDGSSVGEADICSCQSVSTTAVARGVMYASRNVFEM